MPLRNFQPEALMKRSSFLGALLGITVLPLFAQEQPSAQEALKLATQASQQGKYEQAVEHLSEAIRLEPKNALAHYLRGRANFCLGNVKKSVADLDKYVELEPSAASRQWERGISYYYAGEYEKGAKQFELYQTYHDQDVENSTWRYLCVAAKDGVEKAKSNLLPIENDRRVPMMQIYALYQGKATPEDVFKAVEAGNPTPEAKNAREFYANLYVGLWYQAAGKMDLARKHIFAAEKHKIGHYMWDVAHIHADLLRAEEKDKSP